MSKLRKLPPAMAAGLILALALSSSASAFEVMTQTGNWGDFGTSVKHSDGLSRPGAKCGYGTADDMGVARLAWIKVFALKAVAFDRTASADTQPIKFSVTAQSSND